MCFHTDWKFTRMSFLYLSFQRLCRDLQWLVHLSKRPLVILFMLSLEELHRPHPSSWALDYCLAVRDTGSRHSSRTKHGPSGSPFVLSHPLSPCPLSVPRGLACMSFCYVSVKSCRFGNSMSQQHRRWDNESSFRAAILWHSGQK